MKLVVWIYRNKKCVLAVQRNRGVAVSSVFQGCKITFRQMFSEKTLHFLDFYYVSFTEVISTSCMYNITSNYKKILLRKKLPKIMYTVKFFHYYIISNKFGFIYYNSKNYYCEV